MPGTGSGNRCGGRVRGLSAKVTWGHQIHPNNGSAVSLKRKADGTSSHSAHTPRVQGNIALDDEYKLSSHFLAFSQALINRGEIMPFTAGTTPNADGGFGTSTAAQRI